MLTPTRPEPYTPRYVGVVTSDGVRHVYDREAGDSFCGGIYFGSRPRVVSHDRPAGTTCGSCRRVWA